MLRSSGLAAVLVAFVVSACGSGKPATSISTDPKLSGSLNVFAAASLTEAFNAEKATLASSNPALSLTYNFAGSQVLVTQIQQGAPADVLASADEKSMQVLVDSGWVDAPRAFARNKLEIAVESGNPKHIAGLADLERTGITLVLADRSVPAGRYARRAFENAGLPPPRPVSNELDVKSALAKVVLGEADAAVVYVSDVEAAGAKVTGVAIPDRHNVVASYPIAVVKAARNRSAAEAFVDEIVNGSGRQALRAAGFLPPS